MREYTYINEIFLTEAFTATPETIRDAVNNKRMISIQYQGAEEDTPKWRTIMPVCYGLDRDGRQALRAFQLDKPTMTFVPAWKFFLIERIHNWNVSSNKNFDKPRDDYNPKDKHMSKIFASSNFNEPVNAALPSKLDVLRGAKTYVVDLSKNQSVKGFDKPEDAVDYAAKLNKGKPVTKTSGFIALSDKEMAKRNIKQPGAGKGSSMVKRLKTLEEMYYTI